MLNGKLNVLLSSIVIALSASASVHADDHMAPSPTESTAISTKNSTATASDGEMMNSLAKANMAEVALAELAKTKSTDKQVLKFADTMIEDHTNAQKELSEVADQANFKLPKQTDAKHAQMLKKMQTMDSADFDRAYKKQAVTDHAAAQKLLKKIVAKSKNADFKALAKKLTAPIDQHMKMAKEMQSKK